MSTTAVAISSSRPSGDAARLGGVLAFGELLDDLGAEGGQVVGVARAREPLVHMDLLVDPGRARVLEVGLERRPRCQRAALDNVGLDQRPRPVADDTDR